MDKRVVYERLRLRKGSIPETSYTKGLSSDQWLYKIVFLEALVYQRLNMRIIPVDFWTPFFLPTLTSYPTAAERGGNCSSNLNFYLNFYLKDGTSHFRISDMTVLNVSSSLEIGSQTHLQVLFRDLKGIKDPKGGVELFHEKSTCITQSTLSPCVMQLWSLIPQNYGGTKPPDSTTPQSGTWNILRTSTWKPRPESGLDCLTCATFARLPKGVLPGSKFLQIRGDTEGSMLTHRHTAQQYRGTSLIRNYPLLGPERRPRPRTVRWT